MNNKGTATDCFQLESVYTFTTKHNQDYIVNCQLHKNSFYAIKFHLKSHKDSDNKYKLLTDKGDASTIINTVLVIMELLLKENPYVSFGVVGEQLLSENNYNNTKRFQLYSRIFATFFSPINFSHFTCVKSSAYLLINKTSSTSNLKRDIETELVKCYDAVFSFQEV